MILNGILSSPSQRRTFLLTTGLVLAASFAAVIAISYFAPKTAIWSDLTNLFVSVIAGGVFALISGLYVSYFFSDPNDIAASTTLLPEDIRATLETIARDAMDYKIFVRTGRHFRAEILPLLLQRAKKERLRLRIEVILLDFRNKSICERYAQYRRVSSFDRQLWDTHYVQTEVLATILALIQASRDYNGLVDVGLFLTDRLSIFRIEGSSDTILVTREDPKDVAFLYPRTHRNFAAYVTEFGWIRDESHRVAKDLDVLPPTLLAMFGENEEIESLRVPAEKSLTSASPYAR